MIQKKIIVPLNTKKDQGYLRKHEKYLLQQIIQQFNIVDDMEGDLIKKRLQELQHQVLYNYKEITEFQVDTKDIQNVEVIGVQTAQKEKISDLQDQLLIKQQKLKEEYLKFKDVLNIYESIYKNKNKIDTVLLQNLKRLVQNSRNLVRNSINMNPEQMMILVDDSDRKVKVEDHLENIYQEFASITLKDQQKNQQEMVILKMQLQAKYKIKIEILCRVQEIKGIKLNLQNLRECYYLLKSNKIERY